MEEAEVEAEDASTMYQFWVFLVFMIFCWVGQAVTGVMGDAICFELLGKSNTIFVNVFKTILSLIFYC